MSSEFIFSAFLDENKKIKYLPLAPIIVEILISRGSAYKIATDSGTMPAKKPNLSASETYNRIQMI